MSDEKVVLKTCVLSSINEELYAAFQAISEIENCFLRKPNDDIELSKFHSHFKKLSRQVSDYYGRPPSKVDIEGELDSQTSHFVPCGIKAYHVSSMVPSQLPQPKPATIIQDYTTPPKETLEVPHLNYPVISSVQFSFVDEKPQALSLIDKISTQKEIGVELICYDDPLCLSAICISLRECEYLIDVEAVPDALCELTKVFENRNITKIFFNSARTCHLLHLFGISHITNVFCISTAALALKLPPSLEELTEDFRHRLDEGWIKDQPTRVSQQNVNFQKSEQRLSKIVLNLKSSAFDDWRMRPFSLSQMRIARQRMHYLIYLYDSHRLKLKEVNPELLKDVFLISQHKSSISWNEYHYHLFIPNPTICCSIYQQPLPELPLFESLMKLKLKYPNFLTDPIILSICMDIPQNIDSLKESIKNADPPRQLIFAPDPIQIPEQLSKDIINETMKFKPQTTSTAAKKSKGLDDTIAELGWVQNNESFHSPKQSAADKILETTVSPRLIKTSSEETTTSGNLACLRDPDQPTSVSLQIDGIPRTEKNIYQLANNVRMIQKLQGKIKAKLPSGKDEKIAENNPSDILHELTTIGYIDNEEVNKIMNKINSKEVPKPNPKRARSTDSNPQPQKKTMQYNRHQRP